MFVEYVGGCDKLEVAMAWTMDEAVFVFIGNVGFGWEWTLDLGVASGEVISIRRR